MPPFRPHGRQSARLSAYDYASSGCYFVTIVAQDRRPLFGTVVGGEMRLSPAGRLITDAWHGLGKRFRSIELDACVVMPNHVHGVIVVGDGPNPVWADSPIANVVGATLVVAPTPPEDVNRAPPGDAIACDAPDHRAPMINVIAAGATTRVAPTIATGTVAAAPTCPVSAATDPSLGAIVGAFKSSTTVAYIRGVLDHGWPPFRRRLWQRNFYEHIVRDEDDLARIRQYIRDNPIRWGLARQRR